MGKIGGGFWPFLAGKREGSDSEVLAREVGRILRLVEPTVYTIY